MQVTLIPQIIENGKTVEGESFQTECFRVQAVSKTLQNKNGSLVQAQSKFFFPPESPVTSSHKILHNGRKLEILTFYQAYDIDGKLDHYEVTV